MKRNYRRNKEFMFSKGKEDSGLPTSETPNGKSQTFQAKAFKDLRYGLIATKADPQTQATTASQPYALIARTNTIMGGSYPGDDNLNGNVVTQLMISNNSKLINCYDVGSLELRLNYLYLNLDNSTANNLGNMPNAINRYMGVAINEALSRTNAEMTSQLPFARHVAVHMNGSQALPEADAGNKLYILALYQAMLQNTASVLAKYTQLISLEKHLIDMGFNREANFTQELFSLLKKKALVGKLQALATTLFGEYFDADWYKQVNTLITIPSRKSTSVRDPLLVCSGVHVLPRIQVNNENGVKQFDTDTFSVKVGTNDSDPTYTQVDICHNIHNLLDARQILEWSRSRFAGVQTAITPQAYFNQLIDWLDRLAVSMAAMSNHMSDLRTYLDVMGKIGLNQWKVGTMFDISAIKDIPVVYNKILHDTFAAYLNSPDEVRFDQDTQRWTMYTVWNEYTGIHEYDLKSGGSFLAFSLRTINAPGMDNGDTRMLVPVLFRVIENSVKFTARSGFTSTFNYQVMNHGEINDNRILSRLIPMNAMNVRARIPSVDITTQTNVAGAYSATYEILQTVFGYGRITLSGTDDNYALGRDIVSFVDVQINDVNNKMLTFIRSFAPFRVWTISGERTVGFGV